jgi:hypothetical protein
MRDSTCATATSNASGRLASSAARTNAGRNTAGIGHAGAVVAARRTTGGATLVDLPPLALANVALTAAVSATRTTAAS